MLIFNNFTDICAWGNHGLTWETGRLVTDDLVIESADHDYLKGTATDCGKPIQFIVDTATGKTLSFEHLPDK